MSTNDRTSTPEQGSYEWQLEKLKAKLPATAVAKRDQGGRQVSYIEGWYVKHMLNGIFGFDKWSDKVTDMRLIGPPVDFTSQAGKQMKKAGARARVELTIEFADGSVVTREDTGHGTGMGLDVYEAVESAEKEAVTDALKRAATTFGNQFGNSLYDKQQRGVDKPAANTPPAKTAAPAQPTNAPAKPAQNNQAEESWEGEYL
jgi:DNA repair and recombination protein RAD52